MYKSTGTDKKSKRNATVTREFYNGCQGINGLEPYRFFIGEDGLPCAVSPGRNQMNSAFSVRRPLVAHVGACARICLAMPNGMNITLKASDLLEMLQSGLSVGEYRQRKRKEALNVALAARKRIAEEKRQRLKQAEAERRRLEEERALRAKLERESHKAEVEKREALRKEQRRALKEKDDMMRLAKLQRQSITDYRKRKHVCSNCAYWGGRVSRATDRSGAWCFGGIGGILQRTKGHHGCHTGHFRDFLQRGYEKYGIDLSLIDG